MNKITHPAKYSKELLPIFRNILSDEQIILDPFAGTGKLKEIFPNAYLLEIEPEWANINGAIVGDATKMPFEDSFFDAICTSPTYGNRMADSFTDHQKEKKYKRNTYTHCIGRKLNENNTGRMQFGKKYKETHDLAWAECWRVLKCGGTLVLNISNHIRNGVEVDVTGWHIDSLQKIGFIRNEWIKVKTKRNGFGKNRSARVGHESVIVFRKPFDSE